MTNRPTGITILAILLILGAVLNLISLPGSILIYGMLYAAYTGILGVVNLIIGISLWGMQPWARKAAIIIELLGIISTIVMVLWLTALIPMLGSLLLISIAPSMIIPIIVIIYLMQNSIKEAFENPDAASTW
ncbi:MAG: hypothetical protein ACFFF4_10920 [Candidatus Thorarchaeota archaeon]